MEDIQRQVEDILASKGVPPPTMTQEQFAEKVSIKLTEKMPLVLQRTVSQIAKEIVTEEMNRIGRGETCRYINEKSRKYCNNPPDCHECPNYKPGPRWQQWLAQLGRRPELFEPLILGAAAVGFVAAIFAEEIRAFTLGLWFGFVLISRLHIFWLTRRLRRWWESQ